MFTSTKKIQNRISKGQKTNSNPNILTEVRIFELRLTSLMEFKSCCIHRRLRRRRRHHHHHHLFAYLHFFHAA